MELDQISQKEKNIDFKVYRNIRNTFVNIGKYRNAIQNHESTMRLFPEKETGVNAFSCYVVFVYVEKSKRRFKKIMSLPLIQAGKEEGNFTSEINIYNRVDTCGEILEEDILSHSKASEEVFITEYLLVASVFEEKKWSELYFWVHSNLQGTYESLSNQRKFIKK